MSMGEKLEIIAENEPKVYDAGKNARDIEWWNAYLAPMNNGNPNNYLFAGSAWNSKTFYPNQDIIIKNNATALFNRFSWNVNPTLDLAQRLEECGVKAEIDCSQASAVSDMFYYAWITRVPPLNLNSTKYSSLTSLFQSSKMVTVDELIIRDDGANTFSNAFTSATALKNIKITGVIGRTISFSDCPLSVESLKNIISCLKDYTGSSEYSYTITLKSSAFSALEEEGATAEYDGVACTWEELIDNKKWNLTLA